MNNEIPTIPSLPTTAISADAPFSMTYSSETMEVVGKYTWLSVPPDSYSTPPRGIWTDSSCGSQRSCTEGGSAANKWFSLILQVAAFTELRSLSGPAFDLCGQCRLVCSVPHIKQGCV